MTQQNSVLSPTPKCTPIGVQKRLVGTPFSCLCTMMPHSTNQNLFVDVPCDYLVPKRWFKIFHK